MKKTRTPRTAIRGAVQKGIQTTTTAPNLARTVRPDKIPSPIERHHPIAGDTIALFHVVTPRMIERLAERFRRGPVRTHD